MNKNIKSADDLFIDPIYNPITVRCACCGKEPHELLEYQAIIEEESEYYESEAQAVIKNEGTYNRFTGAFYCTSCYIKKGMPIGVCKEIYKD